MTDTERLSGIEFVGVQRLERCELALFNDPVTGSTFSLVRGETIGTKLEELRRRFAGKEADPGTGSRAE